MKSHPLTVGFVPELQPQHNALESAGLLLDKTTDAVEDQLSAIDVIKVLTLDALSALQGDASSFVQRDYTHPLYIALCPRKMEDLRKLDPADLKQALKLVLVPLSKLPDDHPLAKHKPLLAQQLAAWDAPEQLLAAALLPQKDAADARNAAEHVWRLAYDSLYRSLRKGLPEHRSLVEAMMFDWTKKK